MDKSTNVIELRLTYERNAQRDQHLAVYSFPWGLWDDVVLRALVDSAVRCHLTKDDEYTADVYVDGIRQFTVVRERKLVTKVKH